MSDLQDPDPESVDRPPQPTLPWEFLERARRLDSTVHQMLQYGCPKEQIISQLVDDKSKMFGRLVDLEMIAPRKIVAGDRVFVQHCPDDLIPESRTFSVSDVSALPPDGRDFTDQQLRERLTARYGNTDPQVMELLRRYEAATLLHESL